MGKHTTIARAVILAYLSNGLRPEGLYDIYEINHNNKEVLLEHIKALKNIFEKAIEEIEGNKKDDWSEAMCGGLNNADN